jgi:hypothetical protein
VAHLQAEPLVEALAVLGSVQAALLQGVIAQLAMPDQDQGPAGPNPAAHLLPMTVALVQAVVLLVAATGAPTSAEVSAAAISVPAIRLQRAHRRPLQAADGPRLLPIVVLTVASAHLAPGALVLVRRLPAVRDLVLRPAGGPVLAAQLLVGLAASAALVAPDITLATVLASARVAAVGTASPGTTVGAATSVGTLVSATTSARVAAGDTALPGTVVRAASSVGAPASADAAAGGMGLAGIAAAPGCATPTSVATAASPGTAASPAIAAAATLAPPGCIMAGSAAVLASHTAAGVTTVATAGVVAAVPAAAQLLGIAGPGEAGVAAAW